MDKNKNDENKNGNKIEYSHLTFRKTTAVARQILLTFVDVYRQIIPIFDKANIYRVPFHYYDKFRTKDKENFRQEMYRLKRTGFVKKYFDGKDYYLELTQKGKNQLKIYITQDMAIRRPKKWDRKWRLVIYDIANDKRDKRDILRAKLESLGFIKLQESVYVFPFECLIEITLIKQMYYLEPHVQYLVAEGVETEIDLIEKFFDRGILTKSMLD